MNRIISHITSIKFFLIITILFFIFGGAILWLEEKTEIHLAINGIHNNFFDWFFTYWTHAGDGLITAIAILPIGIYLYRKNGWSFFILGWGTLIIAGILAQIGKHLIYPNAMRPLKFIGEDLLYLVPNVDIHEWNSFPSGHTTTAFAFFSLIAITFFSQKFSGQLLCALCAILVGYSRMYLSQHFLEDVIAGAVLGLSAFLLMQFIYYLVRQEINPINDRF